MDTNREELIQSLRRMADYYEAHPSAPLPTYVAAGKLGYGDKDIAKSDLVDFCRHFDVKPALEGNDSVADVCAKTRFGKIEFQYKTPARYVLRQLEPKWEDPATLIESDGRDFPVSKGVEQAESEAQEGVA